MDFYEVIEKRRSIKKFTHNTISEDSISRMIDAAMKSPSWKNNNSYKFIIIDDENKKNELSKCIINQNDDASDSIKQAPLTAVVVANPSESGVIAEREYYLVDSAIAMEHFMLSATAEGYGTCWIASVDEDKVRKVLSIPNEYRVVAMTPVGEIAENKEHYPKKDVRDYIFLNSWDKSYIKYREIKH